MGSLGGREEMIGCLKAWVEMLGRYLLAGMVERRVELWMLGVGVRILMLGGGNLVAELRQGVRGGEMIVTGLELEKRSHC